MHTNISQAYNVPTSLLQGPTGSHLGGSAWPEACAVPPPAQCTQLDAAQGGQWGAAHGAPVREAVRDWR
jgi:hypothetical protein